MLTVKRVVYGKKDTPLQDREYKMNGVGAVGNREDWIHYAQTQFCDEVKFIELDGSSETLNTYGESQE